MWRIPRPPSRSSLLPPEAFIEQLVGEASPVKNELVKMEAGSESETEFEEKPGSIG